jgi:hypothetical protein
MAQVKVALRTKRPYKGTKDFTYFSKYVEFPKGEIVDPLHLIYEGTFKSMIQDWFDSKHNSSQFYLGSVLNITKINEILYKVKFPSDYPRVQREIQKFSYCTANETKYFMLNVAIYALETLLPQKYFDHLCLYVTYVRLLSQPKIVPADIENASELINEFVKQFSSLYGKEKMTHNLHLHLPLQVFQFGGLDMLNAFPLEGYFKICRLMFNGSRAICESIIENIAIKHLLVFSDCFDIENPRLSLLNDKLGYRRFVDETYVVDPHLTPIENFPFSEQLQIFSQINSQPTAIITGTKAYIHGIGLI